MLLHLEVLEASPGVLALILCLHGLFGGFFFKGYMDYRTLHRLVGQGRGELFSYAIGVLTQRVWLPGFADHYRLRHVQGTLLAGLPGRALEAAETFRGEVESPRRRDELDVLTAQLIANIEMGQRWWAEQSLEQAQAHPSASKHRGLEAAIARLAWLRGDPHAAAEALASLPEEARWPFGAVVEARRQVWLGDALRDSGKQADATHAYERAITLAPDSFWGGEARRCRSRIMGLSQGTA
jgi:predicted negative regulator of RcsB-dependent stress response